jgi:hypothetical protein
MSTLVLNAQSKFDSRLDATANVHGCIFFGAIAAVYLQTAATLVFSILPILSSSLLWSTNNLTYQGGVQG